MDDGWLLIRRYMQNLIMSVSEKKLTVTLMPSHETYRDGRCLSDDRDLKISGEGYGNLEISFRRTIRVVSYPCFTTVG